MTSPEKLIVLALFIQVLLAFGLLIRLGQVRVPLVTSRQVEMKDIAVSRDAWPDRAKQFANAVDNQFQLPVLFYVAVGLTLWSGTADWAEAVLAIAFVVLRCVHAFIHITTNKVDRRFFVYAVGFFVLFAYWFVLAGELLAMGGD